MPPKATSQSHRGRGRPRNAQGQAIQPHSPASSVSNSIPAASDVLSQPNKSTSCTPAPSLQPATQLSSASLATESTLDAQTLTRDSTSNQHDSSTNQAVPDESQVTLTQATDANFSQVPDSQLSMAHKKTTCQWTNEDDTLLVNTLIDEQDLHAGTTNGCKTVTWNQAAKALEGSELVNASKAKDASACKSRWHALKKLYSSFMVVSKMSGAGWDESEKMVSLPPSVWRELAMNKSPSGRDLSCWQNQPFPLFHELGRLIEGNVATGELMASTADSPSATQRNVGKDVLLDLEPEGELEEDGEGPLVQAPKPIQTPAKRKKGSAMSPDGILAEMKSMNTLLADSISAPIPPLVIAPQAPPTSVHMQAITLVQKQDGLTPAKIFEAIYFLANPSHAEVYISLNESLRATWLNMKLGW
ncbi:hypothetical protein PCANC_03378 [Puccinia coronata f. sp. avenae]|uniref:Myb-like domain-containing protein n=1 Tax=Puccinia coronata f. sp. avenae TaxID=200324 RepID=A0A2N5T8N6_9BASI|nr:hypothetical protein PCANC_03378 [Puccinia coronata f. sp. avenae]